MKKVLKYFLFILALASNNRIDCSGNQSALFSSTTTEQTCSEPSTVNQDNSKKTDKSKERIQQMQLTDAFVLGVFVGLAICLVFGMALEGSARRSHFPDHGHIMIMTRSWLPAK